MAQQDKKNAQLIWTTLALAVLMAVTLLLQWGIRSINVNYDTLIRHEIEAEWLVGKAIEFELQCRRNEKDFMLRRDLKYKKKHDQNYAAFIETVQRATETLTEFADDKIVTQAGKIIPAAENYRTNFAQLVAGYEKMGLDHKSGLQGDFRNIVHSLMDMAKSVDDDHLMAALLQVRRSEKDFLLRTDEKYATAVHDGLEKVIQAARISAALTPDNVLELEKKTEHYRKGFDALAAETRSSINLVQNMRSSIHKLEPILEELGLYLRELSMTHTKKAEKFAFLIANISWLAIIVVLALAVFLFKLIKQSNTLREIAEKNMEAINTIPTPILKIDPEFNITMINEAAAATGGKSPAELVGSKCYDLFKNNDCKTDRCGLTQAIKEDKTVTRKTGACPHGQDMHIIYTVVPMKDSKGKVIGALEYVVDETSQREVQHQVQENTDEVSKMIAQLGEMAGELEKKAADISENTEKVTVAVQQTSENMNSVSGAVEESNVIFTNVAGATEEMTATVNEIAGNSSQASNLSTEAVDTVAQLSKRVDELNASSFAVASVVDTIVEISEQTKLLALNATIEAARAGEAGKGFAVVANEVKDLARQTSESTDDIRLKIETISSAIGKTVEDIGGVGNGISKVNDIITSIASSVEEQSVTTREIADNISQASTGMNDISSNVSSSAQAAQGITGDINSVSQDTLDIKAAAQQLSGNVKMLAALNEKLVAGAARLAE